MSKICHVASSLPVWHCPWHLVSDPDVARLGNPPPTTATGQALTAGSWLIPGVLPRFGKLGTPWFWLTGGGTRRPR